MAKRTYEKNIIRKMQMKAAMRYLFTSTRMAIIRKRVSNKC